MSAARPAGVRVRVPATTSNLGPGFDVLGMALGLHNEVDVFPRPGGPVDLEVLGEGADAIPRDETNEFLRALRRGGLSGGVSIRMRNAVPVARGLGSSAAARVCGLLAAQALHAPGRPTDRTLLLATARALEGHPDNAVPALLGGVRLIVPGNADLVQIALRAPRELRAVVCVPDFELSTPRARAVLPARVRLEDAVFTASRVGLLVYAFEKRQYPLLRVAMRDVLHQPYRRKLVPGLGEAIAAAEDAGAFGAALSGSGPTVIALAPPARAAVVGRAMQKAFLARRIESRHMALDVDTKGAVVERMR